MSNQEMTRRSVLFAIAVVATLGAAPPASAQDVRFDGVTLRVGTWGGSWLERIKSTVAVEIEKRGAKVEYVIGNPGDNLAKLIAARGQTPPIDVMEFSDNNVVDLLESGFLAPLDYGAIPNAAALRPEFRHPERVSHSASIDGIAYNSEKLAAAGIAPPRTYTDLGNPALAPYVSFPDPYIVHGLKALIGLAMEHGGGIQAIGPGFETLQKMKVGAFYRSSVNHFAKFKAGDVWASPWHAGWVVRARQAGIPLAMAYPEIDGKRGIASNVWLAVIEGSPNKAAAQFFIDTYLAPGPQEQIGRLTGTRPVNDEAARRLEDDPLLVELLPLRPEDFARVMTPDYTKIPISEWVDRWNREIATR